VTEETNNFYSPTESNNENKNNTQNKKLQSQKSITKSKLTNAKQ